MRAVRLHSNLRGADRSPFDTSSFYAGADSRARAVSAPKSPQRVNAKASSAIALSSMPARGMMMASEVPLTRGVWTHPAGTNYAVSREPEYGFTWSVEPTPKLILNRPQPAEVNIPPQDLFWQSAQLYSSVRVSLAWQSARSLVEAEAAAMAANVTVSTAAAFLPSDSSFFVVTQAIQSTVNQIPFFDLSDVSHPYLMGIVAEKAFLSAPELYRTMRDQDHNINWRLLGLIYGIDLLVHDPISSKLADETTEYVGGHGDLPLTTTTPISGFGFLIGLVAALKVKSWLNIKG